MNTFAYSLVGSVIATLVLSGCGLLMPYKDEFRCNKGVGTGYCSSMSENYGEIQKNIGSKSSKIQKTEDEVSATKDSETISSVQSCQKCDDTNEVIWLKQRELEKKYGIK